MKVSDNKFNIIVFYDDYECKISTIIEHLDSFKKYSRHNIFYVIGTLDIACNSAINFADVIIIHYSVRLSLSQYISPQVAEQVSNFKGLKILFIQDEYENTYQAHDWIRKLGINIVFTCVPTQFIDCVYPKSKFPNVTFINNLTGYIPEISLTTPPLDQRENVIVYRGRSLGYWYGSLGQEKYEIGVKMKDICKKHQIQVDIECEDTKRFNNSGDWYNFLLSGRATLATESGANIFDWDGTLKTSIQAYLQENPKVTYQEIAKIFLKEDGAILMNQISPKIFQAIMCRTALILYEGEYSGVVLPGKHYISLRKDWKNIEEVIESLKDLSYISQMTEKAYNDIIKSGKYTYQSFIKEVEKVIDRYPVHPKQVEVISAPLLLNCGNRMVPVEFWDASIFSSIVDRNTKYEINRAIHSLMPININNWGWVTVVEATNSIVRHGFEGTVINKDITFYAAAVSHVPLPHFIEFQFALPIVLSKLEIIWFDSKNFGSVYDFKYLNDDKGYLNLAVIEKQKVGNTHIIIFDIGNKAVSRVLFTVYKTVGQPRLLIRTINFFIEPPLIGKVLNSYKVRRYIFSKITQSVKKLQTIFNKIKKCIHNVNMS